MLASFAASKLEADWTIWGSLITTPEYFKIAIITSVCWLLLISKSWFGEFVECIYWPRVPVVKFQNTSAGFLM